jgi:hypothetical protein
MSIFLFIILAISIFIGGCWNTVFDGMWIFNSKHVGKTVEIAPIARVAKLENFGGWKDRYLYLLGGRTPRNNPESNVKNIEKFQKYKVISEKLKTGSVLASGPERICILENIENEDEEIAVNCEDLYRINYLTNKYKNFLLELKKNNQLYVATLENLDDLNLKKIYTVNRYTIYMIDNESKLKSLFIRNYKSDYYANYSSWPDAFDNILIPKDKINDEKILSSLIFFPSSFYYYMFDSDLDIEQVQNDLFKSVGDFELFFHNIQDFDERFAVRSYITILDQEYHSLYHKRYIDSNNQEFTSKVYLKNLVAIKKCFKSYFKDQLREKEVINMAEVEYFKNFNRKQFLDKVRNTIAQDKTQSNWKYGSNIDCEFIIKLKKFENIGKK